MKPVTLDGLDHYVWEYEPEWGSGVKATFRLETDQVASLTVREQRRAYSESLRVKSVEATYILTGTEAAEVRIYLRILQDTPVRLPFAPALDDLGVNYQARWYLAYDTIPGDPSGAYNLYWTNVDNDLSGRGNILPTLLGHLSTAPKFDEIHTELFSVQLQWRESSGSGEALLPAAREWTAGPAIGARTIYQFPFMPDFEGAQDAGQVVVDVARQNLGFSRTWSSAAYPQLGSRQPKFTYTLETADDIATLLRFFLDRSGPVEVFWVPCWVGECRLALDALAADVTVTVTDATAIGDQRYLQFFGRTGAIVTRHVTAIAGNVLTLDSALGVDLAAADTVLCTLALARFASAELTVSWLSPSLAQCNIQFQEVTQEYITPAGETMGGTIGELPAVCFLYQLNTAGESFYWTSYEKDLTYAGNDYLAEAIEHGEITDGMAWDQNSCDIKMRSWSGNPVVSLLTRTATDRMEFIVARGTPGAPVINYQVLFRGWITSAEFQGAWITATAESFGSLFSRKMPRTILQTSDNYALFDAGNRLIQANWTFTARLTAVAGLVLTLDTITWPGGALPALPDNYFALGQIQRPTNVERIPIVSSTAIAGGVITVTLAHGFMNPAPAPPEAGWLILPGYDGQYSTAVAKFNNGVNFGGFPFIPDTNPSLVPLPTNQNTTKKG